MDKSTIEFKITDKERRLIEIIRNIEFGEINIIVQNNEPIRVQELKRSIKL